MTPDKDPNRWTPEHGLPEKSDYGDPILGRWNCYRTAFCSAYSPDEVRDGGLEYNGRVFICPICKEAMAYYQIRE